MRPAPVQPAPAPSRRGEALRALVLCASFVVSGYAAARLLGADERWAVVAWFVGAAALHDLVLVPFYSGADRLLHGLLGARRSASRRTALQHARVPALLSLLLLLVYWPLVLGDAAGFRRATGLSPDPFTGRWLLAAAALFAASALWLALRALRPAVRRYRAHRRRRPPGDGGTGPERRP